MENNTKKVSFIRKHPVMMSILGVSVLILFIITMNATPDTTQPSGSVQTAVQNRNTTTAPVTTMPSNSVITSKTDQQILEENLASIVSSVGGNDMSYRGLQVEKSDTDRPSDTKMITVSVDVKSFYNKSALLRDTGKLSSSIFKAVYGVPSIKAYDVLVWYRGETTDKYGNKKDSPILTYSIDKVTYGKINWSNFDQSNLCTFLDQEAKTSGTFDTACNVLANIQ